MVEKITVALSIQEVLGSLVAVAFPFLQSLNLSLSLLPQTKKKPKRSKRNAKKTIKQSEKKTILTWTPLLVGFIACLLYTGFLTPGYLSQVRFSQPLPSGAWFVATGGDLLIFFALCFLAADILKIWKIARRPHVNRPAGGFWLSLLVFIVSICLFFVSVSVGSGIFLILLVIALIDLVLWTRIFVRYK